MQLKDHFKKIDQTIKYSINGLMVDVTVTDVTQNWGKVKYLITPVSGTGTVWIVAPEEEQAG